MEPTISRAAFDLLMRRAGIVLTETQAAEIYGMCGDLEGMVRRVWEHADEVPPALVFAPDAQSGEPG
jgi:hypothetical protein